MGPEWLRQNGGEANEGTAEPFRSPITNGPLGRPAARLPTGGPIANGFFVPGGHPVVGTNIHITRSIECEQPIIDQEALLLLGGFAKDTISGAMNALRQGVRNPEPAIRV
jgi:hypothetical protein